VRTTKSKNTNLKLMSMQSNKQSSIVVRGYQQFARRPLMFICNG